MQQPDLTDLKQFRVSITVPGNASDSTIVAACSEQATELGLAIGGAMDWVMVGGPDPETGEETYELRVIPLTMNQLVVLIEKALTRGTEVVLSYLEAYAGSLIPSAAEVVRRSLQAFENEQ